MPIIESSFFILELNYQGICHKEHPRNYWQGTPRHLDTIAATSKVKQSQQHMEQKIGLSA